MPEKDDPHTTGAAGQPPRNFRPGRGRAVFTAALIGFCLYFGLTRLGWLQGDHPGVKHHFPVMNTFANITIPRNSGASLPPKELAELAEQGVREINDLMGPFGDRSDIRRLNESPAGVWVEVDPLTWRVVMEALRWHRLSGGAFDPTIGPVKRLFVFDQTEIDAMPPAEKLAAARELVGADKLLFDREGMRLSWAVDGMVLDLGAIAKGYGADRAAEILAARGVKNAIIEVGGEMRVLGRMDGDGQVRPWRTGVRNPLDGTTLIEMEISDVAVATSGNYESYFIHDGVRYEHIIDPRVGMPIAGGVASVTVLHPESCLAADALATTLCVLGPAEARTFLESQALGLFSKGVTVIMLTVGADGVLTRHDFAIDDKGGFTASETRLDG